MTAYCSHSCFPWRVVAFPSRGFHITHPSDDAVLVEEMHGFFSFYSPSHVAGGV